jgi:Tfp pilus assembly protein PilX
MKNTSNKQSGAVSLFVVIFATLLITVVTVSFLRLMVSDQNRASNSDLSQSAYDSAQAGVEDAKRALLRYQKICTEQGEAVCEALGDQINAADCNDALRIGDVIDSDSGEVLIQQTSSSGAASFDQAYTCVTIGLQTDDYLGSLSANESKLVPLIGVAPDGSTTFNRVTIEWFSADDIGSASSGSYAISLTGDTNPRPLLSQASWPINRPSVLRAQLMQFGSGFDLKTFDTTDPDELSSFDTTTASGESNANTLFLYPSSGGSTSVESFTGRNLRKTTPSGNTPAATGDSSPLGINCRTSLTTGGYACSATLQLPNPVGGGARTAFLRVTPFYNATHFRVTLANGSTAMKFNGVQPEVDSTGRANDLFRRVSSRVDLIDTSFAYPDAAVDVTGGFCKDFAVTDTQYIASNTCTP